MLKQQEFQSLLLLTKWINQTANPDRVMQELTEYELVPEDWGGDTIFVTISAIKGEGIDDITRNDLLSIRSGRI